MGLTHWRLSCGSWAKLNGDCRLGCGLKSPEVSPVSHLMLRIGIEEVIGEVIRGLRELQRLSGASVYDLDCTWLRVIYI